eukprot:TRINITY_DN24660_c0_g1_i1.p1 TRINITY_DN24660_c0_g1~~TRINITY_DN24660_c0_g1_i1.p1  ORF type:complete len:528 (+),score=81.35 TRINITY_DN24660_c0_g1_i1:53-1636(+)
MKRHHEAGMLNGCAALSGDEGGVVSAKGGITSTKEAFRISRQGYLHSQPNRRTTSRKGYVSEPDTTGDELYGAKRRVQPPISKNVITKKKALSPVHNNSIKYITSPECLPPETPHICGKSRVFSPVRIPVSLLMTEAHEETAPVIPSKRRIEPPTSPDPVTGKKIINRVTAPDSPPNVSGKEEYRINLLEGRSPFIDLSVVDPMCQLTPQLMISVAVTWPSGEIQKLQLHINRSPLSMREFKAALHGFIVNEYALQKKAERGINLLDRVSIPEIIDELALGEILMCYGKPAVWKKLTSVKQAFPEKGHPTYGYEFFVTSRKSRSGHNKYTRSRMPRVSKSLADSSQNISKSQVLDKSVTEIIDKGRTIWDSLDGPDVGSVVVNNLKTIPILPTRYLSEIIDPLTEDEDAAPAPINEKATKDTITPLRQWLRYKKQNFGASPTTPIPAKYLPTISVSAILPMLSQIQDEEIRVTRKLGIVNSHLLSESIGSNSITSSRKKSIEHYLACLQHAAKEIKSLIAAHSNPLS